MSDPTKEVADVMEGELVEATPQAEASQAPALSPQAVMDLVSQGQRMLGQGRLDGALAVANSILEDQPDSVAALALKGDSLERLGDYSAALECYERVLELKPDSALDRIRASQLKRQVAEPESVLEEAPPQRRALLAGIAAAVFVLAVGVPILFVLSQGQKPSPDSKALASNDSGYMAENFPSIAPVPTGADGSQNPARTSVPPSASDQAVRPSTEGAARSSVVEPGYTGSSGGGSSRLTPENPGRGEVDPVNPVPNGLPDGTISVMPTQPPVSYSGGNGQPTQADPPDPITPGVGPRRNDPGIIDIHPSAGSSGGGKVGNSGGQEAKDDADAKQSSETLVRVARDAFVRGDFVRAADAYEKALRQGASKGSTNQRLAQCYDRLGRKGDAISAYEKAISAYQSSLSSGSGDTSRIQAALDTCRQALQALRG